MIIKVNKYNLVFSSLTNSIIKKNNMEYCRFHIDNKFNYLELNEIIKIIEYSLFLNVIQIYEKNLDQSIENLFELINLYYDNIYYYAIVINIILHLNLKKKTNFKKILNKFHIFFINKNLND